MLKIWQSKCTVYIYESSLGGLSPQPEVDVPCKTTAALTSLEIKFISWKLKIIMLTIMCELYLQHNVGVPGMELAETGRVVGDRLEILWGLGISVMRFLSKGKFFT